MNEPRHLGPRVIGAVVLVLQRFLAEVDSAPGLARDGRCRNPVPLAEAADGVRRVGATSLLLDGRPL